MAIPSPGSNDNMVNPKDISPRDSDGEEGEIEDDTRARKTARATAVQKAFNTSKRTSTELGVGVYVPPAKRRMLLEHKSKDDDEGQDATANLQRQQDTWQAQKRVIHGTINRLNASTIKPLIQELFQKVNLVRLRGVLCKHVLQAAVSSPKYSDVYAALMSVVNSKLPEVGELLVHRCILAFRRHYKRREKASCQAICIFLAHLFHQAVVHELIILQLLSVLLDGDPTNDSVEVAVQLLQVTGQAMLDVSAAGVRGCLERLRALLHEGNLSKRVEYQMEQLLKQRKTGFRDFPPISDELDLVERDDQISHEFMLDDEEIKKEEHLDVFTVDPDFEESEREWAAIRGEVLGEGDGSSVDSDGSDDGSDDDSTGSSESEASGIPDQDLVAPGAANSKQLTVVEDLTEADLVHLRRTIYLTIMSSATFEECTHKLARIDIPTGRESELINMLIECCSQERTFLRYYGLIGARFCLLDDRWRDAFMESFQEQYTTIHRLETNKLRNVAKLFAHLLHTDSMPWSVFTIVHINEDETTSSSRIFIKIVIQEMAEAMGIGKLKKRFETKDEELKLWYAGMFPKDNIRNTRYAINFFTSIGLGPLTDDLRDFLKNAPKLILAKAKEAALAKKAGEDSDSSSVSSSSSSSSSSSISSSSYTSGSTVSSGSFSSSTGSSSGSYSSYSSHSKSGRRRKSRRYSSGSSYTSSSGSSSSSRSRSRSRSSRGREGRRRIDRSYYSSPPKEIVRKDTGESSSSRGGGGRSPSPLADTPGRRRDDRRPEKDPKAARRSNSRSRSPEEKERTRNTRRRARSRSSDMKKASRLRGEKKARKMGKEQRHRSSSTSHSDSHNKDRYASRANERKSHDKKGDGGKKDSGRRERTGTKEESGKETRSPGQKKDRRSRSVSRSRSRDREPRRRRRKRSRSYTSSSRSRSIEK